MNAVSNPTRNLRWKQRLAGLLEACARLERERVILWAHRTLARDEDDARRQLAAYERRQLRWKGGSK